MVVKCVRDEIECPTVLEPSCKPSEHIPDEFVTSGERGSNQEGSYSTGTDTANSTLAGFKCENCAQEEKVSHQRDGFECCNFVQGVRR